MKTLFWLSVVGILYPYLGYPVVLSLLGRVVSRRRAAGSGRLPSVTMIVPVHNEAARIDRKVWNTASLRYPADRLQVLFVSDGSTDETASIFERCRTPAMRLLELPGRGGKAAALNAALEHALNDILVFSDASIELEPDALENIVQPFQDARVGCVSGEDRIAESGGEGLYGRYELWLRRLESNVHSIVGASGSFYAQRRVLCAPFPEGMAPDFLSVLRTVEQGYRAVSEPTAIGAMSSLTDTKQEFERKVRTLIRGISALFAHAHLLNPLRFGRFAFALWSHKVLRWTVPFFLIGALLAPLGLLESPFYASMLAAQALFYVSAVAALIQWAGVHRSLPGRIALYFATVNLAILAAWLRYARGVRQELWTPTAR